MALPAMPASALAAVLPEGPLGAVVLLVAWLVASYAGVLVFHRVLLVRAHKSKNQLDDIIADGVKGPLYLWLLLAGVWAGLRWFPVVPEAWVPGLRVAITLVFGLTLAWTVVRIATTALAGYGERRPTFRAVQGTAALAVRIGVYALTLVLLLGYLGVEVTPLLGALGIGGIAIALALQDTLANFFGGVYLSLDRPLREGDFVEVGGDGVGSVRGRVVKVTWRSVRIREPGNNTFVVPNGKVASGAIKNYDLPTSEMNAVAPMRVGYDADLAQVEAITLEVAKQVVGSVPGGVPGVEPQVRFHGFDDFGVAFTVTLRVQSFQDQAAVLHAFLKEVHARYQAEGIPIPSVVRGMLRARDRGDREQREQRRGDEARAGGLRRGEAGRT